MDLLPNYSLKTYYFTKEMDFTTKDNNISQTSTTEGAIKQENLTNVHSKATEKLLTTNNKTLEAFSNENLDNKTTTTNDTTLKNIQILDENNNQTSNFLDKNSTSTTTTSTLHSSNFIPETSVSIELNHGENPDEEKENNLPDDSNQVEKDTEVDESDKSGSEIEKNGAENTFEQPIDGTENIEQNKNPKDNFSSQKLPENNSLLIYYFYSFKLRFLS